MKKEEIIPILIVVLLLPIATANTSPTLSEIPGELFVCENSALNFQLNARDIDEQDLTFDISPKDTVFIRKTSSSADSAQGELFSRMLTKNDTITPFESIISVSDGELVDTKYIEVTVIEVNNPPVMENVTLDTVSLYHDKVYWKKLQVSDLEDGNEIEEEITFTLEFLEGRKIFDITPRGEIYFVAEQTEIGLYKMRACATDSGLKAPHKKIDLCEGAKEPKSICQDFQLAITSKNAGPTITFHSPANLNANATKDNPTLKFSITSFDPEGLAPETHWYLENNLTKSELSVETSEFEHTFECGISRKEKVKVEISDGLLTDSLEWEISVSGFSCPKETNTTEKIICQEKMACSDWDVCQNSLRSLEIGTIAQEDYDNIKAGCANNTWGEEICGFQIRDCFDTNSCDSPNREPAEIQLCYFSLNPSCSDNLMNCHNGACEILPDCGGPCQACATCSDGIKNQNELGVDCGGSCKLICSTGFEILKSKMKYPLIIAFILLVALVIFQTRRIKKIKGSLDSEQKRIMGPDKPERLKKEEEKNEKK